MLSATPKLDIAPLTASLIQGLQILYRVRHLRWSLIINNRGLNHFIHPLLTNIN